MASADWSPPEVFDEYRLVRRLGRGGMGEVFLARDMVLDRLVAVKFIGAFDPDSRSRERFLVEARAAARLQHPNVVAIYGVGELDRRPYLITEFIRGESLRELPKPIPWKRALEIGFGLARGLAAAHRRGVLHRDIKPANALIAENGDAKLLDFGLAKLLDGSVLPEEPAKPDHSKGNTSLNTQPYSRSPEVDRAAATVQLPQGHMPPKGPLPGTDPRPAAAEPAKTASAVNYDRARNERTVMVQLPARVPQAPANGSPAPAHGSPAKPNGSPAPANGSPAPANGSPAPAHGSSPQCGPTRAGFVLGTPPYIPPEIWRGEPATRRSDVHALGAVLYELCTGFAPTDGVAFEDLSHFVQTTDIPHLCDIEPSVDPRFGAVVDRCLLRDPARRFASGDELREALEQLMQPVRSAAIPEGNPYRGLSAYEAEHRGLFYGRTSEIRSILDRLRSEPFILVAGDSGVGKSSLCRAGVLPLVEEGALAEGRAWSVARIIPGRRPLFALAEALAAILSTSEEAILLMLRSEPSALVRSLRKHHGTTTGLVIFLDQLEELVTISAPGEAAVVSEALGHLAAGAPGVRLLMTVRGDFLTSIASLPTLGDEVSRALYLLRPMSPERIREAIVGPAQAKGVAFESDALVDTLVESTAKTEGGLPLLQFTLAELWEARGNGQAAITAGALDAIGGVAGALARHADHVLLGMLPAQRTAAQRILIALVTLQGTRTRRTEAELVGIDTVARDALNTLVRGRLLVARETDEGTVYEVAHEALLKGWSMLRRWLDEHEGSRIIKHRLQTAVGEWERLGRSRDLLWSERQLKEASSIDASDVTPREAEFLAASRRAVRRGRFLLSAMVVGVLLAFALVYAAIRLDTRRDIDRRVSIHVKDAETSLAEARAKRDNAEELRRTAFAQFDAADVDMEEAEATWSRVLSISAEADLAYGRASEALETSLILDGDRQDLRNLLADALFERALAAERARRSTQRDELLRRLALYDQQGEHRRRWNAPATLTIGSSPRKARLMLHQYQEDARQKRQIMNERDLGTTPIEAVELAPGSYLLTFSALGHVTVRYPVLLARGERLRIIVDLPLRSAVPEGFVYIPPGRFLYGSGADEGVRRGFFNAVPLHDVYTGGYLIARDETTYADWIEYLQALPPEERARRTPRVAAQTVQGALELKELAGGDWRLTMQPTSQIYSAQSGEPIQYGSRDRRVSQNWLRFPVSGISFEDAQVYVLWLANTGRVPGARLCNEYEWERAARGADDRNYPHGDRLDPDDANYDGTYEWESLAFGPDEVGSHRASRSPFEVDDMAGNVWEWSALKTPTKGGATRGGGYYQAAIDSNVANRNVSDPMLRDNVTGMRVCASPR